MVYADAGRWGVGSRPAGAFVVVPFAGALLVALSFAHRPLFRFLTSEDSLLEWSQFAGYVAAGVLALLSVRALRHVGHTGWSWAFLFVGMGCLLVAGEEISWGQRIFGWGTPEALEEINHQDETTIHNVGALQDAFNVVMLAGAAYGLAVPWLAARARLRRLPWFCIPPLFLSGAFLVVVAYKVLRLTVLREPRYGVVKFGEWPELCFAAALLTFTLLVWRRLRSSPTTRATGDDESPDHGRSASIDLGPVPRRERSGAAERASGVQEVR